MHTSVHIGRHSLQHTNAEYRADLHRERRTNRFPVFSFYPVVVYAIHLPFSLIAPTVWLSLPGLSPHNARIHSTTNIQIEMFH